MTRKAVILAAGSGARLAPMTACVPKELLPIAGLPALHHVLAEAAETGVTEALVVISEGKEDIRKYILAQTHPKGEMAKRLEEARAAVLKKVSVSFAYQRDALGTGDAILAAKEFSSGDPILVTYPDDLLGVDTRNGFRYFGSKPFYTEKIWRYASEGISSVLVREVNKADASNYGVVYPSGEVSDKLFSVRNIVEKPKDHSEPTARVLLGRMVLCASVFSEIERFPKRDDVGVIPALNFEAAKGRLLGVQIDGECCDIGSHEGYASTFIRTAALKFSDTID